MNFASAICESLLTLRLRTAEVRRRLFREPAKRNRPAYPAQSSDECQERQKGGADEGTGGVWFVYRNQQRHIENEIKSREGECKTEATGRR